ncbi:ATPase [Microbacterium sp. B35-04]|uniref:AAA family ATPase n=1 Tax=unclassified Microbacterium TaxID=2609290 RepID=UPI0013D15E3E|nr:MULTISPECIES: AAA family ATPase [unclassified Microbacterium]KAF2414727.1 ATPase [Microbacterium sp. B35-04]KAF2418412.1 ATPase [Microbacterium sp. B35-30]
MTFADTLTEAFKARLPLLYIETGEEVRAIGAISDAAETQRHPRALWTWTAALGLLGPDGKAVANTANPARALQHVAGIHDPSVFVFCDLHAYFGGEHRAGDPALVRTVRETALEFRHGDVSRTLVITAPVRVIPPELDEVTHLLDFPLPTAAEIRGLLETMIDNNASGDGRIRVDADDTARDQLVHAALGLSMAEAENAFARAMVNDGRLSGHDVPIVLDEKRQVVRKSGVLEFVRGEIDLDDVGGLNNLKRWLSRRDGSWLGDARAYGLPAPKGVLITGVPGCGKSLTAKATAASWGLPLLRLDIGRIFSGLVGSSEQNLRTAIATAEAVAPCVLWVDEIEKGFSNTTGQGDSGTTARVFGTFLTWMQEKRHPVFVVATANNIDALPPEFLRKGRFDEIFFVDLPTAHEREVIWRLQLRSRATDANGLEAVASDDAAIAALVAASENHSGAEIEQSVVSALYEGFTTRGEVTADVVRQVVDTMIPLAVTQAEEVQRIRTWATERAVRATGSEDLDPAESTGAVAEGALSSRRGGRTVDY